MRFETYLRGTPDNATKQRVMVVEGRVKTLPIAELMQKLGVNELIRIPSSIYPGPELRGQQVLHVNLPITYSRLQRQAALPKILENGCFNPKKPGQEKTPLLSYQEIWKAEVADFVAQVNYTELPTEIFTTPFIGGAKNVAELQEMVWQRYGPIYQLAEDKGINRQKILDLGISLTWLTLRELVSLE